MHKADLIDKMAADAKITKPAAKAALNSFLANFAAGLKEEGKVQLVGFGVFQTKRKEERTGRNPMLNTQIILPAKTIVLFKAGKQMNEFMNS